VCLGGLGDYTLSNQETGWVSGSIYQAPGCATWGGDGGDEPPTPTGGDEPPTHRLERLNED